MKKALINFILTILFALSIILSLISLTVLNDDYVQLVFEKNDIYDKISKSIEEEYQRNDKTKNFDTEQVKRDINNYITTRYSYNVDIDANNEIYYKHIFFMKSSNIKKYSYIIYTITIILIIITGNIFLHSKRIHNLDLIFLISSIMIILISGCIYIFIAPDNYIYDIILNVTNHVLLGIGVFIFELVFLKYSNIFIHNRLKKK